MKTLEKVLQDFFCTLTELESDTVKQDSGLYTYLVTKLEILHDIIADEIDENYPNDIGKAIDIAVGAHRMRGADGWKMAIVKK